MVHGSHTKNDIPMHLGQVSKMTKKSLLVTFSTIFFAVSLGNWAPKMSGKFRLDHKFCFQNTFYTKCINVIIDSIGPSIILRSIYVKTNKTVVYTIPFQPSDYSVFCIRLRCSSLWTPRTSTCKFH